MLKQEFCQKLEESAKIAKNFISPIIRGETSGSQRLFLFIVISLCFILIFISLFEGEKYLDVIQKKNKGKKH